MTYPSGSQEQRQSIRVTFECLAKIMIGTQFTLHGTLKDLSLKSAFIQIKNSVFLQVNDDVGFSLQVSPQDPKQVVEGFARISRIVPGEGLAIYFVRLDETSTKRLKDLVLR